MVNSFDIAIAGSMLIGLLGLKSATADTVRVAFPGAIRQPTFFTTRTEVRRSLAAFCVAFAVAGVSVAEAAEVSGIFRISLTVVASCNVQTHPLTLAHYATGGAAVGTAVPGSIDVSCTQGTPAAVYLDGNRVLTGPSGAEVTYTLQANGKPWPAGAPLDITGQGREAVHLIVSGSVNAGQHVPVGEYADEKVIRVVY